MFLFRELAEKAKLIEESKTIFGVGSTIKNNLLNVVKFIASAVIDWEAVQVQLILLTTAVAILTYVVLYKCLRGRQDTPNSTTNTTTNTHNDSTSSNPTSNSSTTTRVNVYNTIPN